MCGIAGIYTMNPKQLNKTLLNSMNQALRHRGPDDDGVFLESGIGLAHRRLSIIDLSHKGRQPMSSTDKKLWIVFNGEIYNYQELRSELLSYGYTFHSETDTEIILNAYAKWGKDCLSHFNGMWSFAIWDSVKEELFCARDRFAIKPFVYYYNGTTFIFASEIKALLQHPLIKAIPNYQAIYDFIIYSQVNHSNETFFKDIYQLPGAHYCIVNREGLKISRYWDIDENYRFEGSLEQAGEEFYQLFEDGIRLRFRSDVEVASCLSGGLDSSSIVCAADRLIRNGDIQTDHRLNTFSLAFDYPQYDERKWVEIVKNATRIDSHFIIPTEKELVSKLENLIVIQEEPFGGTSIFGQYMVMKLIHEHEIKVTLDGQGSDEILAGYLRYADAYFADLLLKDNREKLDRQINIYCQKHNLTPSIAMERAKKLAKTGTLGRHVEENSKYLTVDFSQQYFHELNLPSKFKSLLQNQLYHDLTTTSIPALLRYEDRNSMAFSIESRVPFLDYRLVEFSFSLPVEMKMNDSIAKVVLRRAMHGVIPEPIENRQDKMGFVTPETIWFREGLRPLLNEVFYSNSFTARNFFNPGVVRQEWEDYKAGKRNHSFLIWRLACVEMWMRKFID